MRGSPARIRASNCPTSDIVVVHRSDGSGTTLYFRRLPQQRQPRVAEQSGPGHVGKMARRPWRQGQRRRDRPGQTACPASIGYIELAYAIQNKLPMPASKIPLATLSFPQSNRSLRRWLQRKSPTISASRWSIRPGADAYPIAGATWLLVYQQQKDPEKGKKLVEFLNWAITDGEKAAKAWIMRLCPRISRIEFSSASRKLNIRSVPATFSSA